MIRTILILMYLSSVLPALELKPLVTWENDTFVDSDVYYTHGLQISLYTRPQLNNDHLLFQPFLPILNKENNYFSWSLQQKLFTPHNTNRNYPDPTDLPYSGMLLFGYSAISYDSHHMDSLTYHIGLIGPSALGGKTQNRVHRLIGDEEVKGWDEQLDNELLINLTHEHRWKIYKHDLSDLILRSGVSFGNLTTRLTLSSQLRLGFVPDDFSMPGVFFNDEAIGRHYPSGSYFYGFVGLDLITSIHSIYIDGSLFDDTKSVETSEPMWLKLFIGSEISINGFLLGASINQEQISWEQNNGSDWHTYFRLTSGFEF